MRTLKIRDGFTLVELLVVITILAIISVVAYTSFGGATDKAKNSTKLQHLASIEGALNMFFQEKNYYPMPAAYVADKEVWGYQNVAASLSNTVVYSTGGDAITDVTGGAGGGNVMNGESTPVQIGAKGVINQNVLSKQYLSQDLYDPSVKDIKVGDTKSMKDWGVGHYVYGVYAKGNTDWATSKKGSAYNLAATLMDEQKGAEVVKVTGNFDSKFNNCVTCPSSLIGPGGVTNSGGLVDGDVAKAYPISF